MRFNKGRRYTYYSSYSSSRRKRIRWDRIAIIGVVVAVIIGALVWFNLSRLKLLFKGYSFSQQNEILALDGKQIDEILSHDKMSHIEDWIATSQNVEYYDEYEKYFSIHKDLKVKVVVTTVDDIFNNYVPQLTGLGYTNDQIWQLLKTASASDLKYLLDKQYTYSQIQPYMQVKGYVLTDMEKYMQVYAEKKNYNYAVLITTYPFIISENKATQTYTIQNPDDILTLVKKGFQLADSYVPSDLVKPNIPVAPDCDNSMMRKEAAEALEEMYNEAKGLGYNLVINSAYRSYADQKKTYDDYFKRYDEVTAASLVALPGASEHQTGLSVDLTSTSVIQKKAKGDVAVFGDSEEGKWVEKNAYRFGFILRFPLAQSAITGIGNEPWHFRYVGKEAAQKIHDNHWLLEEYCLYEGVIPNIKENK